MNISITFRQMETSDAIKKYVTTKVSRLQKLLQQPLTAKVTLTIQKQLHVAEVQISSGRRRSEARETSEEMYASIDKVVDKLERQISANKGEQVSKKRRSKATVRQDATGVGAAAAKATAPTIRSKTPAKKVKASRQAVR
jgi:putative sigma-54 modulation protein